MATLARLARTLASLARRAGQAGARTLSSTVGPSLPFICRSSASSPAWLLLDNTVHRSSTIRARTTQYAFSLNKWPLVPAGKNAAQAGLVTLGPALPRQQPAAYLEAACMQLAAPGAVAVPKPSVNLACPMTPSCATTDEYLWATSQFPACPVTCGAPASTVRTDLHHSHRPPCHVSTTCTPPPPHARNLLSFGPTDQVKRKVTCELGSRPGLKGWYPSELAQTDLRYRSSTVVYNEDDMRFTAPSKTIQLDGDLADWDCAPIKAQTPFYPYNDKGGESKADSRCCGGRLTMFDDRNGASGTTWDSLDQSSAVSFAWDTQNFYIAVKVIDDSHENKRNSGTSFCYLPPPRRHRRRRRRRRRRRDLKSSETLSSLPVGAPQAGTEIRSRSPSRTQHGHRSRAGKGSTRPPTPAATLTVGL